MQRLVEEGRAGYPEVVVDDDAFRRYLAARVPEDEEPSAYFESVSGPELWLAFACGAGDRGAHAVFEREYFGEIPVGLSRFKPSPELIDEVTQHVRTSLFLPRPGTGPRIAEVAGRGSLRALIRVMALRAGISHFRRQGRDVATPDVDLLDVRLPGEGPELLHMKERHRHEFRSSLKGAISALTSRERSLLRMHFLERVTLQQLATSYRVDRSTVTRWIARARRQLFRHTRRDLQDRLRLQPAELASFIRVIDSCFDISLHRLLDSTPDG